MRPAQDCRDFIAMRFVMFWGFNGFLLSAISLVVMAYEDIFGCLLSEPTVR